MSSFRDTPMRLGSLLVERGYVKIEDLEAALSKQSDGKQEKLLGEILVDLNLCSEDQIVECLAAEYGVPYAKLETRLFDSKITDVLPRDFLEANLVLPLFLVRNTLTVAVPEPSNLFLIEELRALTGHEIQ